jgi:hypothetical protein
MPCRPKRDTRDKPAYDNLTACRSSNRKTNYFSPMVSRAAATTSGGSA